MTNQRILRNGSSFRDFLYNLKEFNFSESKKILTRRFSHEVYSIPIDGNEEFKSFLEKKQKEIEEEFDKREDISKGTVSRSDAVILYSLVRAKEPDVIVETGVCNGMSTAVILKALEDNGKGELYSIDLPQIGNDENDLWEGKGWAGIPEDNAIGWVISEDLKNRWNLIEGDSNYRLPELLEDREGIDIFLHDSEHSYQTMMLEFCISWRKLNKGGLLLADDFDANSAFKDFAESQEAKKYIAGSLGIIKKGEIVK